MTDDPLDAIFDAPEELEGRNREMLAQMVAPFAVVDPENGTFHPKVKAWSSLTSKQRVLVYLLSRLALSTRNPEFPKQVSSKDVELATEMPGGTVRPKLTELVRDRIVFRKQNGYFIRPTTMSLSNAWYLLEGTIAEES